MCGVWVALEDIDMKNGPLYYYKGSHLRSYASSETIKDEAQGDIVSFFAREAKPYTKEYGILKKGQAVIWAANLLHGGDTITDSSRTRLSQVTHYYFDDCLYTTPLLMNPSGKKHIRQPYDFSRNKFIWGRKNGKRVFPHFRGFVSAYVSHLMHRTPSFK